MCSETDFTQEKGNFHLTTSDRKISSFFAFPKERAKKVRFLVSSKMGETPKIPPFEPFSYDPYFGVDQDIW